MRTELSELSAAQRDSICIGAYEKFRGELLAAGVLMSTGVAGVYGKSATYERIVAGVATLVSELGEGRFEEVHFPPVLARATFERTGYLKSFPDLMGSVHVFEGGDAEHAELIERYEGGGDWGRSLEAAEVVLCSAACHAVYPLCVGVLPEGGRRFDIHGYCFRHEPSVDPARMQSFRMHELVYVGDAKMALAHRNAGLVAGMAMLSDLGLQMAAEVANDPFFGRLGTLFAKSQLEDALKIEGVTPFCSPDRPLAVMSANYAQSHFGEPFGIQTADGATAHSSCVAFGLDRIALALLFTHGIDVERWPVGVRARIWT